MAADKSRKRDSSHHLLSSFSGKGCFSLASSLPLEVDGPVSASDLSESLPLPSSASPEDAGDAPVAAAAKAANGSSASPGFSPKMAARSVDE